MRYRRALLPTVKEAPSDATTASHSLLLRAGYIRRVGAGIYSFLPLGVKVLKKIEQIVVEEMNRSGAEQVLLPVLLPAEYFRESGRWDVFGPELFRLKDRKDADYHLGPTHEEIITDLARREIHSYRDLPKNLYQVQIKFRDEPRPRAGLLRCREFLMKDAYSFDADAAGAEVSYGLMRDAYTRIFDRTGLTYRRVSADAGSMGGSKNEEFQVLVHSGEDIIVACESCEYAANLEVAVSRVAPSASPDPGSPAATPTDTPKQKSIEDVAKFLGLPPNRLLKSLLYRAGDRFALAVVRGDHELNEDKLARALGVREIELAEAAAVQRLTGAPVGFAGPVGFTGEILVDPAASQVSAAVCGANATDRHLLNVQFGRDYTGKVVDLRSVVDGDVCVECGALLRRYRGIEAGHIFVLGTHYSQKMGATYLDQEQKKQALVMGCYGIGVSRLVAAAVEQHHDDFGIAWPISVAPYQVHLVQLGDGERVDRAVREIEAGLEAKGLEVLVDDREERPGVKFKDADLIGVPLRVTVGDRGLDKGQVELKRRSVKESRNVELGGAVEAIWQEVELLRTLDPKAAAKSGAAPAPAARGAT
ncbi:MAG: proline--tRNA ligase [Deltaproteobacteria bacterium]